jgi:Subtilase family
VHIAKQMAKRAPLSLVQRAYRAVREEAKPSIQFREPIHQDSTIGVLDIFAEAGAEKTRHGDWVHDAIVSTGFRDQQVLKIENATGKKSNAALSALLFDKAKEPFGERLDAYIETSASHVLAKTNGTLQQILKQPELPLRTLNQSQGNSRIDVYRLLNGAAFDWSASPPALKPLGQKMAKECGLDPESQDFTTLKFRQALVDRVGRVVDTSDFLAELQSQHRELLSTLRERGVSMVKSAGNSADDWDAMVREGLSVPENFDDDVTAVGDKMIVGAFFNPGSNDPKDNELAYYSSKYPAVKVLANGFNVPTTPGFVNTGTSFAAPQVTATLERTRQDHPDWPLQKAESEAASHFQATDGYKLLR